MGYGVVLSLFHALYSSIHVNRYSARVEVLNLIRVVEKIKYICGKIITPKMLAYVHSSTFFSI